MVVEREELADVDAYRDYIHFAIPMVLEGQGSKFDGPYARTVATMRYVADNFTNEKVKQTMLRLLAIEYMQSNGVRNTAELQNIANTYITDPQMLREYKEELESHNLTAIGHPSPDFTATDLTGKSYSLADFRGKYLYIDMWATWCAPCKAELPYFRELVKKFEGQEHHVPGAFGRQGQGRLGEDGRIGPAGGRAAAAGLRQPVSARLRHRRHSGISFCSTRRGRS